MKANEMGIINNPKLQEFFKVQKGINEVKELIRNERWNPEYRHIISSE